MGGLSCLCVSQVGGGGRTKLLLYPPCTQPHDQHSMRFAWTFPAASTPIRPAATPRRHLQRLCRLHVHQAEQLAALHQARRRQQVLRNHGRQGVG